MSSVGARAREAAATARPVNSAYSTARLTSTQVSAGETLQRSESPHQTANAASRPTPMIAWRERIGLGEATPSQATAPARASAARSTWRRVSEARSLPPRANVA